MHATGAGISLIAAARASPRLICATAPTTSGGLDGLENQLFANASDIQFGDLHVLHNIGHGSSEEMGKKVLHVPLLQASSWRSR